MSTNDKNRTDDTPIEDAGVSVRCINGCHSAGLRTIGDVRAYGPRRLLSVPGFGRTSYRELVRLLCDVPPSASVERGEMIPGISLRDYFAGQAIIALYQTDRGMYSTKQDAEQAYRVADAMLAARNPTT